MINSFGQPTQTITGAVAHESIIQRPKMISSIQIMTRKWTKETKKATLYIAIIQERETKVDILMICM